MVWRPLSLLLRSGRLAKRSPTHAGSPLRKVLQCQLWVISCYQGHQSHIQQTIYCHDPFLGGEELKMGTLDGRETFTKKAGEPHEIVII